MLQSVAGPIDGRHSSTFHSSQHPENANRHKISAKEEARKARCKRETALSKAAQSSMEDTLQTHPIKKRNANLIELTRNDVIRQLSICLNFVTFNRPATTKLS
jgi:hypothetical protein